MASHNSKQLLHSEAMKKVPRKLQTQFSAILARLDRVRKGAAHWFTYKLIAEEYGLSLDNPPQTEEDIVFWRVVTDEIYDDVKEFIQKHADDTGKPSAGRPVKVVHCCETDKDYTIQDLQAESLWMTPGAVYDALRRIEKLGEPFTLTGFLNIAKASRSYAWYLRRQEVEQGKRKAGNRTGRGNHE